MITKYKLFKVFFVVLFLTSLNCFHPIVIDESKIHASKKIKIKNHPRLFFSTSDISYLKSKSSNTHNAIWSLIKNKADQIVSAGIPSYPSPVEERFQRIGSDIYITAFAFIITNNSTYFEFTKNFLIEVSSWEYWGAKDNQYDVRDFGLQYMIRGVAFAYDWLYNYLDESDIIIIQNALALHSERMYLAAITITYNYTWKNWWSRSYGQNHWASNLSALGLAALALISENNNATTWLNHVINQLTIKTDILNGINDGSWHEGMQYQNADLLFLLPFYYNLKKIQNIDLIPHTYLENYITWKLYNHIPNSTQDILSFGDYVPKWLGGYGWNARMIFGYIANNYNNTYAQWLYNQELSTVANGRSVDDAEYLIYDFLYYNPNISQTSPSSFPTAKIFPDLDAVIWRTGWGDSDLLFGLKTGDYCGKYLRDNYADYIYPSHDHPDIPSFYIYKGNSELSSELADNHIPMTYYHNTIMVNNQEQFFDDNGFQAGAGGVLETNVVSNNFNFLVADATNRYRQKNGSGNPPGALLLQEFRRYVLFIKPQFFIILDNIRNNVTAKYDWLCFFSNSVSNPVSVESNNWIKGLSSNNNVLGINVIRPQNFVYQIGTRSSSLSASKTYIQIEPPSNTDNVRFFTLFYPTTVSAWDSKPSVSLLADNNLGGGTRINISGAYWDCIFNYSKNATLVTIGEYNMTGTGAVIVKDVSNGIGRIYLINCSSLTDTNNTRNLVTSAQINSSLEIVYSGSTINITGNIAGSIEIWAPVSISSVYINNSSVSFTQNGNYINL